MIKLSAIGISLLLIIAGIYYLSVFVRASPGQDLLYCDDCSTEETGNCPPVDSNCQNAPDGGQSNATGPWSQKACSWIFTIENTTQSETFEYANITVYNFKVDAGWANDGSLFEYSPDEGATWYTLETWDSSNPPPTSNTNKTYSTPQVGGWPDVNKTRFRIVGGAQSAGPDTWTWYVDAVLLNVTYSPAAAPPQWSDNKTSPSSGVTYSPSASYQFNVTWIDLDTDVSVALIEHNFTNPPTLQNDTMSNQSSEYYFDVTDLAAGTYSWKSYANDTEDSWNVTNDGNYWAYIVSKVDTDTTLWLNETSEDKPYQYGEIVNATVELNTSNLQVELWTNLTGTYQKWDEGTTPLYNYITLNYNPGPYNFTGNFSGNANYSASYDSHLLTIWGWSNLTWTSPDDGTYNEGDIIPLTCYISDSNTTNAINEYDVYFYNASSSSESYFGKNYTNSSGYAVWYWDTAGLSNNYYPKCNITDNVTLYYNASGFYEDNTTITILNPPTIGKDAAINNTSAVVGYGTPVKWNVTVTDEDGVSAVFFENDTTNITATQNGNEWYIERTCTVSGTENWNAIYANDTNDQWSKNESISLSWSCDVDPPTYDYLGENISQPHRGDPVNLYANWTDNFELDYAWLSTNETTNWVNYTDNTYGSPIDLSTTSWSNFTWNNVSVTPGTTVSWRIYANDTTGDGNVNVTSVRNLTIWGWSNLSWTSPDDGTYEPGDTIELVCNVSDSNTTDLIGGYDVYFYNVSTSDESYLGNNWTNSSGLAVWYWDTTGLSEGDYYPKCNITDNSTLYYNASGFYEANTTITLSLNVPPTIGGDAAINNTSAVVGPGTPVKWNVTITDTETEPDVVFFENDTTNVTVSNTSSEYWIERTCSVGEYMESWNAIYANDTEGAWSSNTSVNLAWECDALEPRAENETSDPSGTVEVYNNITYCFNVSDANLDIVQVQVDTPSLSPENKTATQDYGTGWCYEINATELGDYQFLGFANDTVGQENKTATTITVTSQDTTKPKWSDNATSIPSGSQYSPTQTYQFNVTWNDNYAFDEALIEHNLTGSSIPHNDSFTGNESFEYYFNVDSLGAGTYVWRSFGNDTSNNQNVTDQWIYVISKVDPSSDIHLALNSSESNLQQTYPQVVNATGWSSLPDNQDLTFTLYRDYASIGKTGDPATEEILLGNGTYIYEYNTTGGKNYTSASVSRTYEVLKGDAYPVLSINTSWTEVYPTATNVSCSVSSVNGEVICLLWRDGVQKTNPEENLLGVGNYVYKTNSSGTANYSVNNTGESQTLTINQGSCDVDLWLNSGTKDTDNSITYPTQANATATINVSGFTWYLDRNGSNVDSGTGILNELETLGVDTYNYTGYWSGNENYTSCFETSHLTVSQNSSTQEFMNLTINDTESNKTHVYSQTTNVTAWYSTLVFGGQTITFTLYRNLTSLGTSNPLERIETLGTGKWNFTYYTPGNVNYSSANKVFWLTIQKKTPYTNIELNASNVEKGDAINITAWASNTILGTVIYANYSGVLENITPLIVGINENITDTSTLSLGDYNASANVTGNANYTDNATLEWSIFTVVDTTPPEWSNNQTSPTSPATYSPGASYQFNVTWTDLDGVDITIIEHNLTGSSTPHNDSFTGNQSSEYYFNVVDLPVGTYVWKSYANDSSNNQNATYQWVYVVQKAPSEIALYLNKTRNDYNYPNNTDANFTVELITPTSGTVYLDTNISGWAIQSESSPLINFTRLDVVNKYNITGYWSGNDNYTSDNETWYATVTTVTMIANLTSMDPMSINQTQYSIIKGNCTCDGNDCNFSYMEIQADGSAVSEVSGPLTTNVTAYDLGNLTDGQDEIRAFNVTGNLPGIYAMRIKCNSTTAGSFYSTTQDLEVNDVTEPQWSLNNTSIPSGDPYSFGQIYQFNVTCTDNTEMFNALIESNFINPLFENITMQNESSEYYYNTDLAAGTYQWSVYCNDTSGNVNQTDIWFYTVAKATPSLNLSFNGTTDDKTYTYPQAVNATAWIEVGNQVNPTLYRNGTNVASGDPAIRIEILGNTTWNFTYDYTGTTNYSASSITRWVFVNKGPTDVKLFLNESENDFTSTYGQNVNITATLNYSDQTFYLYRNGSLINSGFTPLVNITNDFANATYNITANYPSSANLTGDSQTYYLSVNKAVPDIALYLNGTRGDKPNYQNNTGANFTVEFIGEPGKTVYLYTNISGWEPDDSGPSPLINDSTVFQELETYNITGYFLGDPNYTQGSETHYATVIVQQIIANLGVLSPTTIMEWENSTAEGNCTCEGGTCTGTNITIQFNDGSWKNIPNDTSEELQANITSYYIGTLNDTNTSSTYGFNITGRVGGNYQIRVNCTSNEVEGVDETPFTLSVNDYPEFSNWQVNASGNISNGQVARFNVSCTDEAGCDYVNGTVNGQGVDFTSGVGDEWYYDFTCSISDPLVDFTWVGGNDTEGYWNETAIPSPPSIGCDAQAPLVDNEYAPPTIEVYNNITFRFNVTDPENNLDEVWVQVDTPSQPPENVSATKDGGTGWYYEINATELGDYSFIGYANDTVGQENVTATTQTTTSKDITKPRWSNNVTSPLSPITYSPGASYQFNVTWTDNYAMDTVILEFDGQNYTDVSNESSEYYRTFTDLSADSYQFRWYANDTSNKWNYTDEWTYTINPVVTDVRLFLNDSESDFTSTYGQNVNITATLNDSSLTFYLYRNGSLINSGTSPLVNVTNDFANATYNITADYPGTTNYTTDSQTYFLSINKAITTLYLELNQTSGDYTYTYPEATNATAWKVVSGGTLTLERNGTQISGQNEQLTLAAKNYNYTASLSHQNYTASPVTYWAFINKGGTDINLWLNSGTVDEDNSITYPTSANATAQINISSQNSFVLYRNGSTVGSQVDDVIEYVEQLPAKVYNFTAYYAETENYTSSIETSFLTIQKGTPYTNLQTNGTTFERGQIINITSWSNISALSTTQYANYSGILENITPSIVGINTNFTDTGNLNIGVYQISANTTGNENYTNNATLETVYITVQDTVKPDLFNAYINSTFMARYSTVNITIDVTDNTGVSNVSIEITYPELSKKNYTANLLAGDTYRLLFTNTSVGGNYSAYAFANDTSNNQNSTFISNFTVDNEPPKVENGTIDPLEANPSSLINITVDVTDNLQVDEVLVEITYPDQSKVNHSMTVLEVPTYNYTFTDTSTGGVYNATVYANDTSNYVNETWINNFTIYGKTNTTIWNLVDHESKNIYDTFPVNVTIGAKEYTVINCNSTISWTPTGLDLVEGTQTQGDWNISGGLTQNVSWVLNASNTGSFDITVNATCDFGTSSNDTVINITVSDIEPPLITNAYLNQTTALYRQVINVNATITDNYKLNLTWVNTTTPLGSEMKWLMYKKIGDVYETNLTLNETGTWYFSVSANDSSNNLNSTPTTPNSILVNKRNMTLLVNTSVEGREYVQDLYKVGEVVEVNVNLTSDIENVTGAIVEGNVTYNNLSKTINFTEQTPGYYTVEYSPSSALNYSINVSASSYGYNNVSNVTSFIADQIVIVSNLSKSSYDAGETIIIEGYAHYDYDESQVPSGNKMLKYKISGQNWSYADINGTGNFSANLTAPSSDGSYQVLLQIINSSTGIEGSKELPFTVGVVGVITPGAPTVTREVEGVAVTLEEELTIANYEEIFVTEVEIGTSKTISVKMNNTGNVALHDINLELYGLKSSWYEILDKDLDISPGETKAIRIKFIMPRDALSINYLTIMRITYEGGTIDERIINVRPVPGTKFLRELSELEENVTSKIEEMEYLLGLARRRGIFTAISTADFDKIFGSAKLNFNEGLREKSIGNYTGAFSMFSVTSEFLAKASVSLEELITVQFQRLMIITGVALGLAIITMSILVLERLKKVGRIVVTPEEKEEVVLESFFDRVYSRLLTSLSWTYEKIASAEMGKRFVGIVKAIGSGIGYAFLTIVYYLKRVKERIRPSVEVREKPERPRIEFVELKAPKKPLTTRLSEGVGELRNQLKGYELPKMAPIKFFKLKMWLNLNKQRIERALKKIKRK